tara:strand:+ start:2489 stop:3091 length:603 start_codon:yes stop_codon:yes gene_type:complete
MKILFFLLIFFIFANCSKNNTVFWCGDHPCINKKEKEAYFKKTMIVEVKELKEFTKTDETEIEKITQQARIDEKKRIKDEKEFAKNIKLEEKNKIKREKELAKQARINEKKRIKEEKKLAKRLEKDEKKRLKEKKKLIKQAKKNTKKTIKNVSTTSKEKIIVSNEPGNSSVILSDFDKISKSIIEKNTLRPYPDINDIPN